MKVALYLLDSLADWEIAHLSAELHSRRYFARPDADVTLVRVGATRRPIVTMGGLEIRPDLSLDELRLSPEDILVLPGADTWMDAAQDPVLAIAKERVAKELPVAAICGATMGLARVGALDERRHTSNARELLGYVGASYRGGNLYQELLAVKDRNLITASGLAPVDFAYELLSLVGAIDPKALLAWKNLNLNPEPRYFFELMSAVEESRKPRVAG